MSYIAIRCVQRHFDDSIGASGIPASLSQTACDAPDRCSASMKSFVRALGACRSSLNSARHRAYNGNRKPNGESALIYRWAIGNISASDKEELKSQIQLSFKEALKDPRKLTTSEFWSCIVNDHSSTIGPLAFAWVSFLAALGMVALLLTNVLLIATLIVQMLSVERLDSQNSLLANQNKLLSNQSAFQLTQVRIDARRLIKEETIRQQLFRRRWDELLVFNLSSYGKRGALNEFATNTFGLNCNDSKPLCLNEVDLTEKNEFSELMLAKFASRKEFFLNLVEEASFTYFELSRNSKISDILFSLRIGANDCLNKEENTVDLVNRFEIFLRLEFAASALLNARGEKDDAKIATASEALSAAYLDFHNKFVGANKPYIMWNQFQEEFSEVLWELNDGIYAVEESCEYALNESNLIIDELEDFLNKAPSADYETSD